MEIINFVKLRELSFKGVGSWKMEAGSYIGH